MKLENLAIIFVIIIIPITIVLSEYIDKKIDTEKLELEYNKKLLTSTQDAINAYKINTVNDANGDVTNSKISDITTAKNMFFNSLASNFNYIGHKAGLLKEYVPAVAFTLYDGYYIYSPFKNTLTEVETSDESYSKDKELLEGLKPYVYYTCRYKKGSDTDFIITYTLDNYITITGTIKNKYVYDYGYVYSIDSENGITKVADGYKYGGITFKETDTEKMKEFLGDKDYFYVKINGKKYYLDEDYYTDRGSDNITYDGTSFKASSAIFYIDNNGNRNYSQTNGYSNANTDEKNKTFIKYYRAITQNKSSYEYFKKAYEFSRAVVSTGIITDYYDKAGNKVDNGYGLINLNANDAIIVDGTETTSVKENLTIFSGDIQYESSNFNRHRKAVIRYVIETNLAAAISSYSSKSVDTFLMPKISEIDWDLIQNNSCAISFMQGMNIGSKKYNGYSVVPNSYTKEHIDETDIYILKTDNTYARATDNTLNSSTIKPKGDYYSGIWKLNFERKKGIDSNQQSIYYVPMNGYIGSYTSIVGSTGINSLPENDMYKYINGKDNSLKKAYYIALGRERWGAFNINNINFEIYGGNGNQYFLNDY